MVGIPSFSFGPCLFSGATVMLVSGRVLSEKNSLIHSTPPSPLEGKSKISDSFIKIGWKLMAIFEGFNHWCWPQGYGLTSEASRYIKVPIEVVLRTDGVTLQCLGHLLIFCFTQDPFLVFLRGWKFGRKKILSGRTSHFLEYVVDPWGLETCICKVGPGSSYKWRYEAPINGLINR